MGDQTVIHHRSVDDLNVASDYHAVSFVEINYPHTFDFQNQSDFRFAILNPDNAAFLRIDVSGFIGNVPRLFILDNDIVVEKCRWLTENGVLHASGASA
jgi:hypothetical protein